MKAHTHDVYWEQKKNRFKCIKFGCKQTFTLKQLVNILKSNWLKVTWKGDSLRCN